MIHIVLDGMLFPVLIRDMCIGDIPQDAAYCVMLLAPQAFVIRLSIAEPSLAMATILIIPLSGKYIGAKGQEYPLMPINITPSFPKINRFVYKCYEMLRHG